MSYGGADLSTVDPNPSVDDYSTTQPSTDYTGIISSVGQWGATIASIATGNPVAVAPTQGGGYQTIGAAGSGYASNSNGQIIILAVIVIAVFLLLKD